jgi:hypothetical protein
VPAVAGARNKGLRAQGEQAVLAHQSEHALGVDDQALPAQRLGELRGENYGDMIPIA